MTIEQKIMVVDDESDIVRIIDKALQKYGFKVDAFVDPKKALTSFSSDPSSYVLIITDLRMPGLSGIELSEKIWQVRPQMKILFVTAYLFEEIGSSFPAVYKKNIIEKPIDIKRMCDEVRLRLPVET